MITFLIENIFHICLNKKMYSHSSFFFIAQKRLIKINVFRNKEMHAVRNLEIYISLRKMNDISV